MTPTVPHKSVALLVGEAVAECAPLTPAALDATVAALSDWTAVTIAGADSAAPRSLSTALAVDARSVGGWAQLLGTNTRAHPEIAALVNATAAHSLELDDIYSPGLYHPGAPTIAAALAVAQQLGVPGAVLLRGIALGYEVGNRIATALNPEHYLMWHTTGTVGGIGAAAAVAVMVSREKVDPLAVAHAIALAATMGAGVQQTIRSGAMGKALHAGHAAHAGVLAGLAASKGMTGALDVLEGPAGLAAATGACVDAAAWETVTDPLDPDNLTIGRTSVKPYPCCGHTFAAIDGALRLRSRLGPHGVERLDAVEVSTYDAAVTVAGIANPRDGAEARFSIAYLVACALRTGDVTLASFDAQHFTDPAIRALMQRIRLTRSAVLTAAFPQRRGARVSATCADRVLIAECPDRPGDPANPLPPRELRQKFDTLVSSKLLPARSDRLWADIAGLATFDNIRTVDFGSRTTNGTG